MAQELKVYHCNEWHNECTEFYLKYEADKVIAEKDAEIAEQKRLRNMALASVPNVLKVMKIIQHHKHKRCLAMARWCEYFANYWECCEPPDCGAFIARAKFHRKWLKRWLELAEKFKEA